MTARRIVFIGAAGEMCKVAIERFGRAGGDFELTLCDIRPELLQPLVKRLPADRVKVRRLDLYDRDALLDVVRGAALVVLGAGPYIRTSEPVITACIELKMPYLDFDDDVESTQHALSLAGQAQEAGVPLYIGCGASPGMSNVLAVDAASELDTVEDIEMFWTVGDERPDVGRAVIQHLMHIAAGDCLTWENGEPVTHQSYVETGSAPMGGGLGETLLYETAHPEPVTMPRRFPGAQRIRCLGGMDPAPINGLVKGLGHAIESGRMTSDEAVDFMMAIVKSRFGTPLGWRHALGGMIAQVRRGESGTGEMLKFLGASAVRRRYTWRGGLLARVRGTRDGRPAVAVRRTPVSGPGSYLLASMATVTGTACAAFMVLALDEAGKRAGSFAPEDWAEPEPFYTALERVGTPRREIVESVR